MYLTSKQVKENIKNNVKMRLDQIPFGISIPAELLITDYIDDQIITDQYEDYIVSNDK